MNITIISSEFWAIFKSRWDDWIKFWMDSFENLNFWKYWVFIFIINQWIYSRKYFLRMGHDLAFYWIQFYYRLYSWSHDLFVFLIYLFFLINRFSWLFLLIISLYHYIHQTSKNEASTFWTGCGAIRREVFFKIGKFNEHCRMMEDIELGYRLKAQNHRIRLVKDLYVKHLKHYSFLKLLKSDLFDRAIPWTILMLKNKQFTSDLNVKRQHKLSAILIILMVASLFIALKSIWFMLAFPVLLGIYILINHDFYQFFYRKRGLIFSLSVIPLHFLYYFYGSLGFILGICKYLYNKNLY